MTPRPFAGFPQIQWKRLPPPGSGADPCPKRLSRREEGTRSWKTWFAIGRHQKSGLKPPDTCLVAVCPYGDSPWTGYSLISSSVGKCPNGVGVKEVGRQGVLSSLGTVRLSVADREPVFRATQTPRF